MLLRCEVGVRGTLSSIRRNEIGSLFVISRRL